MLWQICCDGDGDGDGEEARRSDIGSPSLPSSQSRDFLLSPGKWTPICHSSRSAAAATPIYDSTDSSHQDGIPWSESRSLRCGCPACAAFPSGTSWHKLARMTTTTLMHRICRSNLLALLRISLCEASGKHRCRKARSRASGVASSRGRGHHTYSVGSRI